MEEIGIAQEKKRSGLINNKFGTDQVSNRNSGNMRPETLVKCYFDYLFLFNSI